LQTSRENYGISEGRNVLSPETLVLQPMEAVMLVRALPILLVLAALVAFNAPILAEDKDNAHTGTVVSAGDGKLTMTDAEGKEHTHSVAAKAKITCDGKVCKLEELKKGTKIRVTTKKGDATTALRIEAKTK
jgi:hypothetical protein